MIKTYLDQMLCRVETSRTASYNTHLWAAGRKRCLSASIYTCGSFSNNNKAVMTTNLNNYQSEVGNCTPLPVL